jgi:hypothetical protein
MRSGWRALVFVFASWQAVASAGGVALEYRQALGAGSCADEAALKRAVIDELHRDPFGAPARYTFTVTFERDAKRARARIVLTDDSGRGLGERELSGRDCDELVPAMAWVIALAVGPLARPTPRPATTPPATVPTPEVVERVPPPALEVRRAPRRRVLPFSLRLSAGVIAALDAGAATTAPGFTLAVGLLRKRYSLSVEVRGDLPSSTTAAYGGSVETSLVFATLVPCVHHRVVAVCALAAVGAERGSGTGYAQPHAATAPFAALGGRLAVELPFASLLAARVYADLLGALTHLELYVGTTADPSRRVYRTPSVSSALGLALLAKFP